MNSDHDIEVTEETTAATEAIESVSDGILDHAAAAAVEAADLSDDDEEATLSGDDEDEDGEDDDEDEVEEDGVKVEGEDDEDESGEDKEEAA